MLDLGWTEILVIGVVALIVIGPRDLPGALHTFGKYVGRMRAMVRDFQNGIDDIARQHELRELQKSVQDLSPKRAVENFIGEWEKEEGAEAAPPARLDAPAKQPEGSEAASKDGDAAAADVDAADAEKATSPEAKPGSAASS